MSWTIADDGLSVRRTRSNGDQLVVEHAFAPLAPGHLGWEVTVMSKSECCEYITEWDGVPMEEAMAHAEGVDLYADATGSDFDDCPHCIPGGPDVIPENAPRGALDVWLRLDADDLDELADAEANTFPDEGRFRVDWYLSAVGLVTSVYFNTYAEACGWLTREGFDDYSA